MEVKLDLIILGAHNAFANCSGTIYDEVGAIKK